MAVRGDPYARALGYQLRDQSSARVRLACTRRPLNGQDPEVARAGDSLSRFECRLVAASKGTAVHARRSSQQDVASYSMSRLICEAVFAYILTNPQQRLAQDVRVDHIQGDRVRRMHSFGGHTLLHLDRSLAQVEILD